MTDQAIRSHLLGKDSYRRTRFVILEHADQCAVAAVSRDSEEPLFSSITDVEVLALPGRCRLVEDDAVDTGNPSALAAKALQLGLDGDATLVVRGMDQHVNFIYRPNPTKIRVVDVSPPYPSKLLRMAQQVINYVDLPAVHLVPEIFEMKDLAASIPEAESFLIPCRASGLGLATPTYYLDERPARQNWTMIACERSRQIHQHFYGDEAPRVEMCPRQLVQNDGSLTLIRCCLLENRIELEDNWAIVPWGATLAQLEDALKQLIVVNER